MNGPSTRMVPRATYRLQFGSEFTFDQAREIVSYLRDLGVSHVYASPYLKARPGSSHGYDVIDHNALNPEVGGDQSFNEFCDALDRHGLGQIVDFVPNHMGVGEAYNAWWQDVLERGQESAYAEYFDIDWAPAKIELRGKVLLPFLGDHYGAVIENGELSLAFDPETGALGVSYYEHRFPITPGTYTQILRTALSHLTKENERGEESLAEFELLLAGFRDLRKRSRSVRQRSTRRTKADRLKRHLSDLAGEFPVARGAIESALAEFNGTVGKPKSFERLHRLLEAQHYRLAYWRVAAEEINYRRFFQINDLAGIRVEVPEVFDSVHRLLLRLVGEDKVHGVRIDHIDGLFDPGHYLQRLQSKLTAARGGANGEGDPKETYVVVEKILAAHERLRDDWPVAGMTGYEFLNRLNGLFVDPRGERGLTSLYARFIGEWMAFEDIAYNGKKQAMDLELASELRVLANEFNRLAETSWLTRDHTLVGLRQALREVVAAFPVYRTYVGRGGAGPDDRRDLDWALAHARKRSKRADKTVFDFIYGVLSTDFGRGRGHRYNRREVQRLAMKFQQYTGPVMAKGVEDTAFYRYNRLISLNEVGGDPNRFGTSVAAFHRQSQEYARRWPLAMLCTATHDTKRGEDTRSRINVLSEIPEEWGRRVRRWAMLNRRRKVDDNGMLVPRANDEYLLYQTLVGTWPISFGTGEMLDPVEVDDYRQRIQAFMQKAVREAKVNSSWIEPSAEYEDALEVFISRLLDVKRRNPFLTDFREFHKEVARLGMLNALAQTVLKLTAPGVPDIYQGCELWDLSLVDPDNRRPVDFPHRAKLLSDLGDRFGGGQQPAKVRDLLEHWPDGRVKMFIVWRLLGLRASHPEMFLQGAYVPVDVEGAAADHLCCFLRKHEGQLLLVAVPRLMASLVWGTEAMPVGDSVWRDTRLLSPDNGIDVIEWQNVFTGERLAQEISADGRGTLPAARVLRDFPMAVLLGETPKGNEGK